MADIEDAKRSFFLVLMIVGPYVMHRLRRSGASRAKKDYPALAEKLGLSLRSAEGARIGVLSGDQDGYRVVVDPDDRPRIVVYCRAEPPVILRTFEHEKRVPAGMIAMTTPGRVANRFFKDCYAEPELGAALAEREDELDALLRPFSDRWPRNLVHLSITSERLECALDFGRPNHISREVVEVLLPASVSLVRFVESLKTPQVA
jgi:hypothetical protein